jgi:FemAB-related protein (PEP-CTERM system-associated)
MDDHPSWDEFVYAHPHGSPFHLQAWRQTIEESFGYRSFYTLAVEGPRIRGVLPMFLVKNILVRKALISCPFAVYGGILADSRETAQALSDHVKARGERLGVQYIELRNAHVEQCVGSPNLLRYVTFTQNIGPDEESMLEAIPRKTRYMVRKALKYDYASATTRTPHAFEGMYSLNLRRLGTPSFPHRYFASLLKNFGNMAEIREFRLDGHLAAAVFSFYFRDQVLPYYGASDPSYNSFSPNNFMYFDLMRWAGSKGIRMFDFGRSKKNQSGSYDFKAHWGMEERPLPYEMILVKRRTLPNFSPANPAYQLPIRVWQHMPLQLTRAVGPLLIRLVP